MFQTFVALVVVISLFVGFAHVSLAWAGATPRTDPNPYEGIESWRVVFFGAEKGTEKKLLKFVSEEANERGIRISDVPGRQVGVIAVGISTSRIQDGNIAMVSVNVSLIRYVSVINKWGPGRAIAASVWSQTIFFTSDLPRIKQQATSSAKVVLSNALSEISSYSPSL